MSGVSWGTRPPLFHRPSPQRGSLKADPPVTRTEFVRRPELTAVTAIGSPGRRRCRRRRRPPRPVASWGPRYRYDVDIWRALLLRARPASTLLRISLSRAAREWFLLRVTPLPERTSTGIFRPHCSETAFCGEDRRRSFMRYCLIIRRQ